MRACIWSFLLACLVLLASPLTGAAHAATAPCHGQMAQTAMQVQVAVASAHAGHAAPATMRASGQLDKCSVCSPCCAGALVNTVFLHTVAALATGSNFPEPASASPAPMLAGLDRPPRPLAL